MCDHIWIVIYYYYYYYYCIATVADNKLEERGEKKVFPTLHMTWPPYHDSPLRCTVFNYALFNALIGYLTHQYLYCSSRYLVAESEGWSLIPKPANRRDPEPVHAPHILFLKEHFFFPSICYSFLRVCVSRHTFTPIVYIMLFSFCSLVSFSFVPSLFTVLNRS